MNYLGRVISGLCLAISAPSMATDTLVLKNKDVLKVKNIVKQSSVNANQAKTGNLLTGDYTHQVLDLAALNADYGLKKLNQTIDKRQVSHTRYQQVYKNIPIWGKHLVIHTDKYNALTKLNGQLAVGVEADLNLSGGLTPNFDKTEVLNFAKQKHQSARSNDNLEFSRDSIKLIIYQSDDKTSTLAYHVSFFVNSDSGYVALPTYIINAHSKRVLKQWNGLNHAHATGPGGNEKTGRYEYGTDYPHLDITETGNTCSLENENVKTINLDHGTHGTEAHTFDCSRNTDKEINGAYSPLNDAHSFGNAVFNMYDEWYQTAPLSFQLLMKVHYSHQYENAFWDGSSMTFGDGHTRFHPLVSLDVVAHEVAHGVTDQNSDLIYSDQSGGINEAFSDMTGEAAEFYVRGENDWLTGADIFKGDGALRYMEEPPLDGVSIGHADDYHAGMDVHHSSGVFNRAFFLLSNSAGWDIKKAYDVMLDANRNYWTPSTNFEEGACGVVNAAEDLGYDVYPVLFSFEQVGVMCENLPFVDNDGDQISDYWEAYYGLDNTDPADATSDLDNDGLNNLSEYNLGTKPNDTDSDDDGLSDGAEVNDYNTDPANKDSDQDGIDDGEEVNTYQTNPAESDTDSDGMPDGWEILYGLNPLTNDALLDKDSDGRTNIDEFNQNTNPALADVLELEPNDSIETAQSVDDSFSLVYSPDIGDMSANTSQSIAHVSVTGTGNESYDFYSFDVSTAESLGIFDIDAGVSDEDSMDSYLTIFNSDGTELADNDDSNVNYGQGGSSSTLDSYLEYTFEQPGRYFVRVGQCCTAPINEGANYVLHISLENTIIDTDSDGLPDSWEQEYGLDFEDPNDANLDNDEDGLSNLIEYQNSTDPTNSDTDSDGLNDGDEVLTHHTSPILNDTDDDGLSDGVEVEEHGTNPISNDSDADGLLDGDEIINHQTDPLLADSDTDGLTDGFEIQYGFDPNNDNGESALDADNDGLTNLEEFQWSTNPLNRDTDSDMLSDSDEINTHNTSPTNSDSDMDGLIDGLEVNIYTTNPLLADSDQDGMPDGWEIDYLLDPLIDDSQLDRDNDGKTNIEEYEAGTNPNELRTIELEPNDSMEQAQHIDNGFNLRYSPDIGDSNSNTSTTIPHTTIIGLGDETFDYFSFDVETANSLGIFDIDYGAEDSGFVDTYITIYDAQGNALWVNDDSSQNSGQQGSSSTLDSYVEYTFENTGRYFVEVGSCCKHPVNSDSNYVLHISIENTASDDDDDGISDYWEDSHRLNRNDANDATLDYDQDGLSNQQEFELGTDPLMADTDADGVIDSEDEAPQDASIGENVAPIFVSDLTDVTIEAEAELTHIQLTTPEVTDNNINPAEVTIADAGPFGLGTHVITWTATDAAGNSASAEQTVHIVDTTGPDINTANTLLVDARGFLTDISKNIVATANDLVDGEVEISYGSNIKLQVGNHDVTLTAKDKSENTSTKQIAVTVVPELQLTKQLVTSIDQPAIVKAKLAGGSIGDTSFVYAVNYNGSQILQDTMSIDGDSANFAVSMPENIQAGEEVTVQLISAENAFITSQLTTISVTNENKAPRVDFVMTQAEKAISTIEKGNGQTVITANAHDINGDALTLTWSGSDSLADNDDVDHTFTFDPISLTPGLYELEFNAQETNTSENLSTTVTLSLVVADNSSMTLSQEVDSDGDGISDALEGFDDADLDGIPNYLDFNSNTSTLPMHSNEEPMQTLPHLRMSLGDMAKLSKGALASNGLLSYTDIHNWGNNGQPVENGKDEDFIAVTSINEFTIAGLSTIDTQVPVVIPLATEQALPADATYRKYIAETGWFEFVNDAHNSIHSALKTLDGNCPRFDSDGYQQGLVEGNECILLIIEDGGPNDGDRAQNGMIKDPGVLVIENENKAPVVNVTADTTNVTEKDNITLAASATDINGDELTYIWTQISGPALSFDKTAATITIAAPEVSEDTTIEMQITVSDSERETSESITFIIADESDGGTINMSLLLLLSFVLLITRRRLIVQTR